jgi:hypothetical protein
MLLKKVGMPQPLLWLQMIHPGLAKQRFRCGFRMLNFDYIIGGILRHWLSSS